MKFNIGDRVRVLDYNLEEDDEDYIGKIGTIRKSMLTHVDEDFPYHVFFDEGQGLQGQPMRFSLDPN